MKQHLIHLPTLFPPLIGLQPPKGRATHINTHKLKLQVFNLPFCSTNSKVYRFLNFKLLNLQKPLRKNTWGFQKTFRLLSPKVSKYIPHIHCFALIRNHHTFFEFVAKQFLTHLCDVKWGDETLTWWYNVTNCQKQNTTKLSIVDGDGKGRCGWLVFFVICFVSCRLWNAMFLW